MGHEVDTVVKRLEERAKRYEEAAEFWVAHGDPVRADLEQRNADIQRAAAEMCRQRAALAQNP